MWRSTSDHAGGRDRRQATVQYRTSDATATLTRSPWPGFASRHWRAHQPPFPPCWLYVTLSARRRALRARTVATECCSGATRLQTLSTRCSLPLNVKCTMHPELIPCLMSTYCYPWCGVSFHGCPHGIRSCGMKLYVSVDQCALVPPFMLASVFACRDRNAGESVSCHTSDGRLQSCYTPFGVSHQCMISERRRKT